MIMNIINGSMMITSPRPLYNNTGRRGGPSTEKNTNTTISQLGCWQQSTIVGVTTIIINIDITGSSLQPTGTLGRYQRRGPSARSEA